MGSGYGLGSNHFVPWRREMDDLQRTHLFPTI
jgi:hypothetical protein